MAITKTKENTQGKKTLLPNTKLNRLSLSFFSLKGLGWNQKDIADLFGVDDATVSRKIKDIEKIEQFQERNRARVESLEHIAYMGFLKNLQKGNIEGIKLFYKGLGILAEKVELGGAVVLLSDIELKERAKEQMIKLSEGKGEKVEEVEEITMKHTGEIVSKKVKDSDKPPKIEEKEPK